MKALSAAELKARFSKVLADVRRGMRIVVLYVRTKLSGQRREPRRTESAVFEALSALAGSPGYAHAIAVYWLRENMYRPSGGRFTAEALARGSSGLTRREIDILIGLVVQGDLDLRVPKPSVIRKRMRATDRMMGELQESIGRPLDRFLAARGRDFGEALREPIIYGPEPAYETQYLDLAIERYSEDDGWLRRNVGFTIGTAVAVAKAVVEIRSSGMESVLRGAWRIKPGRRDLLAAFVLRVGDIAARCGLDPVVVRAVLEAFALCGRNEGFASASDFNAVVAAPFIRLGRDSYLLFQNQTLAEAVYTTPSYWMAEDAEYRDSHSDHRGRFTERFCHKRLSDVFGQDRVFSNVKILKGKRVVGEIDVLVLYGNRAIVLQAKSKRLTVEARKGDLAKARDDFAKAVQHASDQGFSCAQELFEPDCVLAPDGNERLTVASELKEAHVMCVVSEPYPALTFQAGHFLEYKTTARIQPPLVADVFLIDVLAEMLSTPLQFLSYVNRRVTYHEKILTPDELAVLALHLRENLWVEEDTDKVAILDQGTWDLDVAMMVRRAGMPGKATPDGVLTRLTGTLVGSVLAQIEAEPNPAAIELGLMLLKLGESVVQQIDTVVDGWRNCPNRDGMYGFSMSISGADTGLTLLANCLPQRETEIYAANTCLVRKYESRVTTWFGVVLDGRDFTTLRHVRVVSYTWEADEALAKAARRFGGKRVR